MDGRTVSSGSCTGLARWPHLFGIPGQGLGSAKAAGAVHRYAPGGARGLKRKGAEGPLGSGRIFPGDRLIGHEFNDADDIFPVNPPPLHQEFMYLQDLPKVGSHQILRSFHDILC